MRWRKHSLLIHCHLLRPLQFPSACSLSPSSTTSVSLSVLTVTFFDHFSFPQRAVTSKYWSALLTPFISFCIEQCNEAFSHSRIPVLTDTNDFCILDSGYCHHFSFIFTDLQQGWHSSSKIWTHISSTVYLPWESLLASIVPKTQFFFSKRASSTVTSLQ
jgi:hypothetical protein